MDKWEHEWQEEQQRVDHVVEKIAERLDSLQEHTRSMRADIVEIRNQFWEDVTVNVEDAIEAAETYASIKQQAEVLSERERSHRHAQRQLKALMRLKQSPYFGRIDLKVDGEEEVERIYLGIASFFDEESETFLVYDWRAPISSLYYDYSPGKVEYRTSEGTLSGVMELKRQYVIRNGHIHSMFDTGITIGDELLREVLGRRSDMQMKSIVATIQKEQNEIIRDERSRLLIVQGASGSGKTSVALQRVAYLLYRYRETLRPEQIVLFSPNPLFNSYVSTVLPELGEENMRQTTFQEYLESQLNDTFHVEDPFSQLEYVLTHAAESGYQARVEGIRFKSSLEFMEIIHRYVAFLGQEGLIFKDITFRGEVLISAERVKEKFYSLDDSLRIPNRMKLLAEWLLEELKNMELLERSKAWVEDEIELLDKATYYKVYQKLRRQKQFTQNTFDDFEREQEMLAMIVVREAFKPLFAKIKRLHFIDIQAIYRQLFVNSWMISRFLPEGKVPKHWEEICRQTVEKLDRFELAYEDATPYLYLRACLEGFQINTSVRHVFIDEAQDYSPFQFAFIKRLFPFSKLTVLGDLNQSLFVHETTDHGFSPLLSLFESEETKFFALRRSYRSTRPIVDFTRGMIENGEEIEPFQREGKKPTVTPVADMKELVKKVADRIRTLQSEGYQTIAVICKTAKESKEAYEALKEEVSLSLIDKETISFEPGVIVIPSYLAKGVEFDAVIIYNGSETQYSRENERKLFYTCCTRAMHELHIYFIGKMSPFISLVSSDTYVFES
ncbi:RNA polymerase recycling motor HelD [Thermoflavimicrobium dichotomicum]|uniref:DNA helicase-2 / ATP-dependent DNA helicase PcrA n=1 Tax=Thermoflavimicrobium dichotomicum TaxID=46223 RepID=A0A1I3S9Q7_9BACL|nr:RNA polymerase recycling motor HelD [Thermoflavimicrobium dichotomicum]SFJ54732.1 DNA helicase-2 / ATP-dependent DNA helicase PcrA [Thermoflavimicrobium dichotomicum]